MTGIRKRSNSPRVDQGTMAQREDKLRKQVSKLDAAVFSETGHGPVTPRAKQIMKQRDAAYDKAEPLRNARNRNKAGHDNLTNKSKMELRHRVATRKGRR